MDIFAFLFMISSCSLVFHSDFSNAADIITQSQSLTDDMTLVSKDGSFELGFFNPGSSKNRYLGIWFNNIPVKTVVWVANRLNPINDSSGVLMVNSSGSLVLLSQNSTTVVLSANSTKQASNPIVQLLDSGNLVVRDGNEQNPNIYLWQSFDYPGDTWLPGMKLGWDLKNGLEWRLSSWKSPDDPSPGELSAAIEPHNYADLVMKKGSEKLFRLRLRNSLAQSGVPAFKANSVYNYSFFSSKDELFIWVEAEKKWSEFVSVPKDDCDTYNLCGVYGNCIIGDTPICQCLEGFKPKSQETWNPDEWSKGCVRTTQLSCHDKDKIGFDKLVGLKLPDATYSWVNASMNLEECKVKCLNDCNCTAYSNSDIRNGGSGCAIWYGDLIDIRQISVNDHDANVQDVYIRMLASDQDVKDKSKRKVIVIVLVAIAIAVVFGVFLTAYCICKRTNFRGIMERMRIIVHTSNSKGPEEDMELSLFNLSTIARATDDFSLNNKLGEGGFGPVYKVTIELFLNFFLAMTFLSGYMSPEYAVHGQYSIKSDVFSFGVLILEIISGKKNRGFRHPEHLNLLGHAWRLWIEDRPIELIDDTVGDFTISEVLRCIHVGLLCVQKRQEDRPNMSLCGYDVKQ
uniref:Receptor-like serine/threonine-protein kinase n=1 Tax=Fagus sylvatica TaxID=28930 RepID=A0A2N9H2X2_FAGSY